MRPDNCAMKPAPLPPTHTFGKWAACPCHNHKFYRIETNTTGNDCQPVAELRGPDREANAKLIAAAPDLLQAAKEVIAAWERGDLAAAVRGLACTVREAEG